MFARSRAAGRPIPLQDTAEPGRPGLTPVGRRQPGWEARRHRAWQSNSAPVPVQVSMIKVAVPYRTAMPAAPARG